MSKVLVERLTKTVTISHYSRAINKSGKYVNSDKEIDWVDEKGMIAKVKQKVDKVTIYYPLADGKLQEIILDKFEIDMIVSKMKEIEKMPATEEFMD